MKTLSDYITYDKFNSIYTKGNPSINTRGIIVLPNTYRDIENLKSMLFGVENYIIGNFFSGDYISKTETEFDVDSLCILVTDFGILETNKLCHNIKSISKSRNILYKDLISGRVDVI